MRCGTRGESMRPGLLEMRWWFAVTCLPRVHVSLPAILSVVQVSLDNDAQPLRYGDRGGRGWSAM